MSKDWQLVDSPSKHYTRIIRYGILLYGITERIPEYMILHICMLWLSMISKELYILILYTNVVYYTMIHDNKIILINCDTQ